MHSTHTLRVALVGLTLAIPACEKPDPKAIAASGPETPAALLVEYPSNELGKYLKVSGTTKMTTVDSYAYTVREGYTGYTQGKDVIHDQPYFIYDLGTEKGPIKLVSRHSLTAEGTFVGKWCQAPKDSVFKLPENSFFILINDERGWPQNKTYNSHSSPIEK